MIVNLGPQHPSTHGVFRMVVALDGETIVDLKPVMGYLHRNHEKIGERNTFLQNMPFTDRLDYFSSMSNNFGYALAVEKLMGVKPPERAEYIRVIMAELTRIATTLVAIGCSAQRPGRVLHPGAVCVRRARTDPGYLRSRLRLAHDVQLLPLWRRGARSARRHRWRRSASWCSSACRARSTSWTLYLTDNEIVRARCEGVGVLTAEEAIAYSAAGPVLRASGVPYDVRRADPYSIYDRFDFDVAVRYHGDVYDRYLIRMDEMRQSVRILQQAVRDMPEGPIQEGKPQYQVRVPAGEVLRAGGRSERRAGFLRRLQRQANPWRYHVRAPSFINLTALETMCVGNKIADVVVILGSIDIVLGEADR